MWVSVGGWGGGWSMSLRVWAGGGVFVSPCVGGGGGGSMSLRAMSECFLLLLLLVGWFVVVVVVVVVAIHEILNTF